MFKGHFGMSFKDLDAILGRLLTDVGAVIPEARIAFSTDGHPAETQVRPATRAEIRMAEDALIGLLER